MKCLTLLGATGSIGTSTLDIIRRHPDCYQVFALTGHRSVEKMAALCREFNPRFAVMADPAAAAELQGELAGMAVEVLTGVDGLCAVSEHPDVDQVLAAIVGAAGLAPTMAAVKAGKRVLLANKEALVMAGALFMAEVAQSGAELLPVDSEHNAIFQSMPDNYQAGMDVGDQVSKIILTASGGPFRELPLEQFATVTPEQAINHPNWSMGPKISVDSATMMNKGLELIEARWLFNMPPENIEVVVHPQSIIHSMVAYHDGSVLAQMGNPDMRTPIAHCLAWPGRIVAGVKPLDLVAIARLDFAAADFQRFPCLALAYEALRGAPNLAAIVNAANEVAVALFLEGKIGFMDIAKMVEGALARYEGSHINSITELLDLDQQVRAQCQHDYQLI